MKKNKWTGGRNILLVVLRKIWALYAILIFIPVLIIIVPVYYIIFLIFGKKAIWYGLYFSQWIVSPLILFLMLIWVRKRGNENVDKTRTFVVISNHSSHLDMFVNAYSTSIIMKFLSKKELKDVPVLGIIMKYTTVLVDRKSKISKEKGFQEMRELIRNGMSIFIYPEGTRNRTDEPLKDFYDGAFRLAIEAQVPLLVNTLVNMKSVAPPHVIMDQSPGVVTSYWDVPIETTGMTLEDLPTLREQARQIMQNHLTQHQ